MSYRDKVIEFHQACNIPGTGEVNPAVPPTERVHLRRDLVAEEFLEFCQAIDGSPIDLAEVADALADLIYIIEGTALEFGIDLGPVFDEIHRANMCKAAGPKRADGKQLKPEGWRPPDIAAVLRQQRVD